MVYKRILSLLLIISSYKCIFDDCMNVHLWTKLNKRTLSPKTNVLNLIQSPATKGTPEHAYLIGQGSFGKVFSVDFLTPDPVNKLSTAMKVVTISSKNSEREEKNLVSELTHLKSLFGMGPLYFLKYFGCIKSWNNPKKLILFTEKLDKSLRMYVEPKHTFKDFDFAQQIGLFLMMARSLSILEDNNLTHLDIKPDNFMIYTVDNIPIVKLIDYGIMHEHGSKFTGGSRIYIDPYMYYENYKVNSQSDVYSLLISYVELYYGPDVVLLEKACFMSDMKVYLQCIRKRYNHIKDILVQEGLQEKNRDFLTQINNFNQLIIDGLVLLRLKPLSLQRIVDTLNTILEEVSPDSVYLKKKEKFLEKLIYNNNYNETSNVVWTEPVTTLKPLTTSNQAPTMKTPKPYLSVPRSASVRARIIQPVTKEYTKKSVSKKKQPLDKKNTPKIIIKDIASMNLHPDVSSSEKPEGKTPLINQQPKNLSSNRIVDNISGPLTDRSGIKDLDTENEDKRDTSTDEEKMSTTTSSLSELRPKKSSKKKHNDTIVEIPEEESNLMSHIKKPLLTKDIQKPAPNDSNDEEQSEKYIIEKYQALLKLNRLNPKIVAQLKKEMAKQIQNLRKQKVQVFLQAQVMKINHKDKGGKLREKGLKNKII